MWHGYDSGWKGWCPIGICWKQVVDMICRKCRLISNVTSRGGRWCTGVDYSGWASDRLRYLSPRFWKILILKHCRPERILVYSLSWPRNMMVYAKVVWRGLDGHHYWGLQRDRGRIRIIRVRIYVALLWGYPIRRVSQIIKLILPIRKTWWCLRTWCRKRV